MIALLRTRDYSAGNWQILLTNSNLNTAADGVYMALTIWVNVLECFSKK